MDVRDIAGRARTSAERLATASTTAKNAALRHMAARLDEARREVLEANEADLEAAREAGLARNLVDRLRFGPAKIDSRIRCLEKIAALPDPVGQAVRSQRRPSGLRVSRVRVPLGVILMIYEARPHVTVNAGAFCVKAGNAAILRGGSEARRANSLLGRLWRESLEASDLPADAVQTVAGSHEEIGDLLDLEGEIDLVIPRGGKRLIEAVARRSRIPVIKHFAGVCHVYVDDGADPDRAARIAVDSKCLMPEVCNAAETLLVAEGAAEAVLPVVAGRLGEAGVTLKGCPRTREIVPGAEPATEDDWRAEYLDLVIAVRVIAGVDDAIDHINRFGSHHTDAIVTDSAGRAQRFVDRVDSAVVLVNASTMFCDGESLGMGAEIGISTDRLHARGPMGLEELTTTKFVIRGDGHVMGGSS